MRKTIVNLYSRIHGCLPPFVKRRATAESLRPNRRALRELHKDPLAVALWFATSTQARAREQSVREHLEADDVDGVIGQSTEIAEQLADLAERPDLAGSPALKKWTEPAEVLAAYLNVLHYRAVACARRGAEAERGRMVRTIGHLVRQVAQTRSRRARALLIDFASYVIHTPAPATPQNTVQHECKVFAALFEYVYHVPRCDRALLHYRYGRALFEAGRHRQARDQARRALANLDYVAAEAEAHHIELAAKQMLQVIRDTLQASSRAAAAVVRARYFAECRDFALAAAEYHKAVACASALYQTVPRKELARVYTVMGEYDKAVAEFERLPQPAREGPEYALDLATTTLYRGIFEERIDCLEQAREILETSGQRGAVQDEAFAKRLSVAEDLAKRHRRDAVVQCFREHPLEGTVADLQSTFDRADFESVIRKTRDIDDRVREFAELCDLNQRLPDSMALEYESPSALHFYRHVAALGYRSGALQALGHCTRAEILSARLVRLLELSIQDRPHEEARQLRARFRDHYCQHLEFAASAAPTEANLLLFDVTLELPNLSRSMAGTLNMWKGGLLCRLGRWIEAAAVAQHAYEQLDRMLDPTVRNDLAVALHLYKTRQRPEQWPVPAPLLCQYISLYILIRTIAAALGTLH